MHVRSAGSIMRWAALLVFLIGICACTSQSRTSIPPLVLTHAEAVRGDWQDSAPPATGWVPVTLMDQWQARWPGHDGVVWYRLQWNQVDATQPAGVLIEYLNMADVVPGSPLFGAIKHVNGVAPCTPSMMAVLNSTAEGVQKRMEETEASVQRAMMPKMEKVVEELRKEGDYSIIIEKKYAIWADPSVDLTKKIVDRMNAAK